ncbi:MAG: PQQ-like beta-propeller repeat protein [Pirellulales bacterium]|nr:PQQ-like beta-propeller repeat protein [Pirellulales bacterium]
MNARTTALAVAAVCLMASSLLAQSFDEAKVRNWHHWRGPHANGVAPEGNPPLEWSETQNIKWKAQVPGQGISSPIIWGDRVFLATAIDTGKKPEGEGGDGTAADGTAADAGGAQAQGRGQGQGRRQRGQGRRQGRGRGGRGQGQGPSTLFQFVVLCLDRNTGETIWQKTANEVVPHEGKHGDNTYASASPTTDGENLYVSFGSRGVYCFDLDGNKKWSRDLGKMRTRNGFGEGASPVIHGDTLIVAWDHEGDSSLYALNAKNGETLWQVERDEVTTWNTPLVVEHEGMAQVVVNGSVSRSYNLANGELVWECGGQVTNPIPSPVAKDGTVYCMTGYRGHALYAIPLSSKGDVTDSESIVWSRNDGTPYVPSPLLYGDLLYFTKSNNAILTCVDAATGDVKYENERLRGVRGLYASPVGAAGRVYITGRGGSTLVVEHGEALNVLATNVLDEPIDATPAVVGNQIFLRGSGHLYCIEEKAN